MPPYLLVQRFSHLSLASERRPSGLGFRQSSFSHTRLALTAHVTDDSTLRGLVPTCCTPPSLSRFKLS